MGCTNPTNSEINAGANALNEVMSHPTAENISAFNDGQYDRGGFLRPAHYHVAIRRNHDGFGYKLVAGCSEGNLVIATARAKLGSSSIRSGVEYC